ncbi:uncharacterized protein LOC143021085 [Oratosquilla oratoria]|uniref:uncharacterized protein LOC143021085 n=1 Tax=Oratosquilla oratoria TaxID=337810 RepID=UPI003F7600E7
MAGVARKYRRLRNQRDLRHEYRKLRRLLPQPDKARGKVAVVDAAHAYILQLQTALLDQLSNRRQQLAPKGAHGGGGGGNDDDVANMETVRNLAIRLIRSRASARSSRRSPSQACAHSSTPSASQSFSSPPECSSVHPSTRPSTSGITSTSTRSLDFEPGTSNNQKLEIAPGKNSEEGEGEDTCEASSVTHLPLPPSSCTSPSSSISNSASMASSAKASRRKSASVVLET